MNHHANIIQIKSRVIDMLKQTLSNSNNDLEFCMASDLFHEKLNLCKNLVFEQEMTPEKEEATEIFFGYMFSLFKSMKEWGLTNVTSYKSHHFLAYYKFCEYLKILDKEDLQTVHHLLEIIKTM